MSKYIHTSPMLYDPVSLGAAGTALAGFFATEVVAGVTIGAIALTTALSGASFLINAALAPNLQSSKDQGQKLTVQQAVPSQRMIYGEAIVGGPLFFYECKPPYLYLGIVLASHEIDSVPEVRIGDEAVVFDSDGNAINSLFHNGTVSLLKCSIRLGTADQAIDPILAADFPELESTFRQRGHATAVLRLHYGTNATQHEKYWGTGSPKPLFLVRGRKIYDPRKASHDIDDPTTWEWSDNASLCLADFLTHYKGCNREWSQLNLPSLIDSANADDEQVLLLSGAYENRYTINGVIDLQQEAVQAVLDMLTANLGRLVWSNGQYHFFSGVPRSPVWTITDDSARGAMTVRYARPRRELVNTVRTIFTSPEREYQDAQGPVYSNATFLTEDGEPHEITITLPFTASHTRAQRIAKATAMRARLGKKVARSESIEAIRFMCSEILTLESASFPKADMVCEINALSLNHENLEVEIDLEQYDGAYIYAWDATVDEQDFSLTPTELEGVN